MKATISQPRGFDRTMAVSEDESEDIIYRVACKTDNYISQ
jgi:hypothetical protein